MGKNGRGWGPYLPLFKGHLIGCPLSPHFFAEKFGTAQLGIIILLCDFARTTPSQKINGEQKLLIYDPVIYAGIQL